MPQAHFPSYMFPAPPDIFMEVPANWSLFVAPTALMAAEAPVKHGAFHPNVVVTWTRFPAPYTLDLAKAEVLERYQAGGDWALIGERTDEEDGKARWICEVSFAHPEVGTLVQANVLTVVSPTPAVFDLVHACGTCSAEEVDDHFEEVRSTTRSLSVKD
jgi:hypothetical protein